MAKKTRISRDPDEFYNWVKTKSKLLGISMLEYKRRIPEAYKILE